LMTWIKSWRSAAIVSAVMPMTVCHEGLRWKVVTSVASCTKDEGRPLGTGLQEQVSNHLKLLW
jgi:hypothetical protein